MTSRNRRRGPRSSLGLAAQVVFLPLVIALMVSARSGRVPVWAAVRFPRWKGSVARSRDQVDGGELVHRRHSTGPADLPAPASVRAWSAHARAARRRDGVAGFLIGLLLVTLALAAAVALAAQPVQ